MPVLFAATPGALSAEQTCEYLGGISLPALRGLVEQSLLVPVEVAGTKRFRRKDLDAYLEACDDWETRKRRPGGAR